MSLIGILYLRDTLNGNVERFSIPIDEYIRRCNEQKERIYHAAMFDPHTSAELTLDEMYNLVDDLFAAHGEIIPPMH